LAGSAVQDEAQSGEGSGTIHNRMRNTGCRHKELVAVGGGEGDRSIQRKGRDTEINDLITCDRYVVQRRAVNDNRPRAGVRSFKFRAIVVETNDRESCFEVAG
jgi:hypothetical protein